MSAEDRVPLLSDPAEPSASSSVSPFARFPSSSRLDDDADALPLPATALGPSAPRAPDPFAYPPAPRRSTLGARKGKGRAVEPPSGGAGDAADDEDGQGAGPTGLSFCVRFTDGQTEDLLDLWVGEKESVREVKRRLRLLRPATLFDDTKPRRLRLIQLGRLLPDGVFLVPYTAQLLSKRAKVEQGGTEKLREGLQAVGRGLGKVVRGTASAVAGAAAGEEDELDALERGKGKGREDEDGGDEVHEEEEQQIWLHCSVGEAEEEEAQDDKAQTAQITPLQGFDRLRDAGFSDEEIENLRAEFRETHTAPAQAGDDAEHQRALEEQWMSGMTGQEEAATGEASGSGNYYSLLKGISIGFFVPFLPLFFFRTQLFTRRMQIAIVLGVIINLGFGFLRFIG
ncbi:hypothetical protein JCM10450v2_001751 [Rhodotorula kratochvilovae]